MVSPKHDFRSLYFVRQSLRSGNLSRILLFDSQTHIDLEYSAIYDNIVVFHHWIPKGHLLYMLIFYRRVIPFFSVVLPSADVKPPSNYY